MNPRSRGGQGLSNDQLALMILAAIGVSVMVARYKTLLAGLGGWLQRRHLVVAGPALVQIPNVGGLDGPRLLILAGTLLIVLVLGRIGWRLHRKQADG